MNPFEAFAEAARKHVENPAKLLGPTKTRAGARETYAAIVSEIQACEDGVQLDCYLTTIRHNLAQFRAELTFLWEGDGDDFIGLSGEIDKRFEELRAPGCEAARSRGQ